MHVPRAARSAMMSSRRTWRGRYQDRVKLVCLTTAGTTKCLGTPLAAFGGILMRSILITVTHLAVLCANVHFQEAPDVS